MKILKPKEIFFNKHKNQTIQQTANITEKENIKKNFSIILKFESEKLMYSLLNGDFLRKT